MDLWQPVHLENRQTHSAALGPLMLWLRREEDELHVASERTLSEEAEDRLQSPAPGEPTDPDALEWTRYILGRDARPIRLRPMLPSRPLVARPESTLLLPPGREATFYLSIPICLGIEEQSAEPIVLTEAPTVVLSNIWFGDPMSGELCYSLTTRARRSIAEGERRPYRAICAFTMANDAEQPLTIERLRVHGPNLALYDDGRRLWTDRIVARFQDPERGSEMKVEPRKTADGMTRCAEPRVPIRGSIFTRVFGRLADQEMFQR